jgi:hypothetical protein
MVPIGPRSRVLVLGFVLMIAPLFIQSCGDDAKSDSSDPPETAPADTNGNAPAAEPAMAPSPEPVVPLPSPSPCPSLACAPCPPPPLLPAWLSVQEYKDCPFPDCPARMGFEVSWSGAFLYGDGPQSALNRADLGTLSDRAEDAIEQNLLVSETCVSLPPLVGRSSLRVYITARDGRIHRVYALDNSDNSLCWRGSRGRAEDLAEALDALADRYHP